MLQSYIFLPWGFNQSIGNLHTERLPVVFCCQHTQFSKNIFGNWIRSEIFHKCLCLYWALLKIFSKVICDRKHGLERVWRFQKRKWKPERLRQIWLRIFINLDTGLNLSLGLSSVTATRCFSAYRGCFPHARWREDMPCIIINLYTRPDSSLGLENLT